MGRAIANLERKTMPPLLRNSAFLHHSAFLQRRELLCMACLALWSRTLLHSPMSQGVLFLWWLLSSEMCGLQLRQMNRHSNSVWPVAQVDALVGR